MPRAFLFSDLATVGATLQALSRYPMRPVASSESIDMVMRSASPCRAGGCRELVRDGSGYCAKHAKRPEPVKRESSTKRGYGYAWQKARAGYLRNHPLCRSCEAKGLLVAAEHVDHIKPHHGDKTLFWDSSNWQPLCAPCHSEKTASEDGGFGNATARKEFA